MKTFALRVLLVLGVLLVGPATAFAQVLPSFSTWENDKHSILSVGFVNGAQFSGVFINHAAGFQCQNIPYPVTGSVLPNGAITFVVDFTACSTVTTWRGRVMGSRIATKWFLVYRDSHGGIHRMRGADLFTRR